MRAESSALLAAAAAQVEAQQGGMAEQRDRLHALLASQAAEKQSLEEAAVASAAERALLASQLAELQVRCTPRAHQEPQPPRAPGAPRPRVHQGLQPCVSVGVQAVAPMHVGADLESRMRTRPCTLGAGGCVARARAGG